MDLISIDEGWVRHRAHHFTGGFENGTATTERTKTHGSRTRPWNAHAASPLGLRGRPRAPAGVAAAAARGRGRAAKTDKPHTPREPGGHSGSQGRSRALGDSSALGQRARSHGSGLRASVSLPPGCSPALEAAQA
eukprot:CAMPEP_0174346204 /NCGR_PEP_ID=MMETSP0811_2-20130205/1836_1 /TAXON_ID=73025 ORGANISM="Eutreptiella gymnastica-like, Strain CCMP1594" /NCGR_SAMPLE_ID=MMETSP0811_2 /ASSEMBLY_ACC=CAM_ASM_000667 /LENGTH=134 /DNA_ID=CAMNT_0015470559 /DNA_START=878 /DNA_END=1282 /DNA_ORIENTATION=-